MSDPVADANQQASKPAAVYPAVLGLRDSDDRKALEMAIMLDEHSQHPDDSPHMIVLRFLRAKWPQITAAAELEHVLSTSAATLARIEEAGGLQQAVMG